MTARKRQAIPVVAGDARTVEPGERVGYHRVSRLPDNMTAAEYSDESARRLSVLGDLDAPLPPRPPLVIANGRTLELLALIDSVARYGGGELVLWQSELGDDVDAAATVVRWAERRRGGYRVIETEDDVIVERADRCRLVTVYRASMVRRL